MQPHKRIKKGWMDLKIVDIRTDTPDTKTLFFVNIPENTRAFDYYAGQYLTFRFDDLADRPLVRSYTMSSSPIEEENIAVTVKEIPQGVISHYFCQTVKIGDVLRARGPIGRFIYEKEKSLPELVMIAAGSGVTPFISIMREFSLGNREQGPAKMTLIVGYRSESDIIGKEEFVRLKDDPRVNIVITLSREKSPVHRFGRISTELVEDVVGSDFSGKTFMACGPDEMMLGMQSFILEKGVAKEQFHMESFA